MSDRAIDPRFESLLREALASEAASVPLRVRPDQILERAKVREGAHVGARLRRHVLGHPSTGLPRLSMAVAAGAAAVVVVAALALNFVVNQQGIGGPPPPTASPRPTVAVSPSVEPTMSDSMWPQSSIDEVRQAQGLADAGDPDYTWQVDPQLSSQEWWGYIGAGRAEIVERFLGEKLGWDQFLFNPYQPDDGGYPADAAIRRVVYLRCAPGETNPLYPITPEGPQEAPGAERCAPTLDDFRYETVSLDLSQLDQRGPAGIWVVSQWTITAPFTQTDPNVAEADATALLEDFLAARIEGQDAEGLVEVYGYAALREVPLLYATTAGAPYERYEIDVVSRPQWPYGEMEFTVRLFAEGGATVVEQPISLSQMNGRLTLWLEDTETTENGQPLAVPYEFLDGEVTLQAAYPWAGHFALSAGIALNGESVERLVLLSDPLPVATGCEPGPAAVDAEALARAVQSDPDVESTAPVSVTLGGIEALSMDVSAAPGASVCLDVPGPQVLTPDYVGSRYGLTLEPGTRMRLYLIDAPEGSSMRILAIAIVAPQARFESVVEAAAPIVDSLQFNAP